MDVLFLSQRVPFPPDRGDRITTHHFLQHLLARGDRVRVGCFSEGVADDAFAAELGKKVEAIAAPRIHRGLRKLTSSRALLTGGPLTLPFFRHAGLARTVARWMAETPADVIYVYSSSMAQYVIDARFETAFRIMQFAELDSDKWRQYAEAKSGLAKWIYAREARELLRFERTVAKAFDVSFVCSPVEAALFERNIPDAKPPVVLPNGVDVDHFTSAGDDRREPDTVIFTGVMDYEPNVDGVLWFVAECWPRIRAKRPGAKLLVVGSRPNAAIRGLDGKDGIEVTGRVPETPPWFDRASVAIAPLRLARGVQNKVLEAMSMGLPVVSTPQAAQGIEVGDGEAPLVVVEGADATTDAVVGLLRDSERARELGRRAAGFVRDAYRWERMYGMLDRVLERSRAEAK